MKEPLLQEDEISQEKAFSRDQFLRYARDIGTLYEKEVAQRKALELANRQLLAEMQDRIRLQDELQQSEQRYRSLFESSHEAIFITDCNGALIDANDACLKLIGYDRSDVVGVTFLESGSSPCLKHIFEAKNAANPELREADFRLTRQDGTVRECRLTASLWLSGQGVVLGYQGIIRDVTEDIKKQRILELASKMEAIANMAGGIAHEIRNPLAVSSSAAQLLINGRLAPHLKTECVSKVVSGINRASLIIENLLAFARPMTDYAVVRVSLSDILTESVRAVEDQALRQNVQVITHLSPGSLALTGNSELLHRAFLNLLVNSLAAMPNGGRLVVTVNSNQLIGTVEITYSREGLEEERSSDLSAPCCGDLNTNSGLELGLSVARSIICHHSGTLQVHDFPGKSSRVRVTLPLVVTIA